MEKAVMISIRPEWCEKIASGKKTVEVRKTKPKLDPPFKCYIYCTKPKKILRAVYTKQDYSGYFADEDFEQIPENYKTFVKVPDGSSLFCCAPYSGNVIGEFVCNRIEDYSKWEYDLPALYRHINLFACIDYPELYKYLPDGGGYGWHISDLVIYDKPQKIGAFMRKPCDNAASCGACVHSRWSEENYSKFIGCSFEVKRPPQSWFYINAL